MNRRALVELAEALPAGTAVPVPREWLLELLGDAPTPEASTNIGQPDLTVRDLAARFGRQPSTVRMWLEAGRFPQAYRFQNREWRVPLVGVQAFEADERQRAHPEPSTPGAPVDLGAWRRHLYRIRFPGHVAGLIRRPAA